MRVLLIVLFFVGICSGAVAQTTPTERIGPFSVHETEQPNGVSVKYYLSETNEVRPLVVFIQGSGCTPVFRHESEGRNIITIFGAWDLAINGRANVLLIEKPHAGEDANSQAGSAQHCSSEFNSYFTAENWENAISHAMREVRTSPKVDKEKTLIIGTSEGAVIAAMLARDNPFVSEIALIGASGTTQIFDFFANSYQAIGTDSARIEEIEQFQTTLSAITSDPDSSVKFAWGHPYKRWTSFFHIELDEILPRVNARIYFLIGMQDRNVPALSTEVAIAKLLLAEHSIFVRRLPDAGHMMLRQNQNFDDLQSEYDRIFNWFLL